MPYIGDCNKNHKELEDSHNFRMKEEHEGCCDQCAYGFSNGHFAPSMWCIKHKTNDGTFFIKEYGGGTGCDDFVTRQEEQ